MRAVADDYSGPFDAGWSLERLSRAALARLCREYMLVSMLHDRSLMPHIAGLGGMAASVAQADDEWMAASPIYTARNKANLGITGDGAAEVLKSFQFDVGMPHHFLDFHGEVVDHDLGYFWLPYCGAHDYVRTLSGNDDGVVHVDVRDSQTVTVAFDDAEALHDLDTPSPLSLLLHGDAPGFEPIAQAVNPRARVRRSSADDLVWSIEIEPDAEPIGPHPLADLVGSYNYLDANMGARPAVPVTLGPTRG